MDPDKRRRLQADCDAFHITEEFGFVLEEPLTSLPDYYQVWMDLANDLPQLIESHRLRELVDKMPLLSLDCLTSHQQLRLAHLALGYITMGYVWQEGRHAPAQVIPKALAWPYWHVSNKLELPAILTYADSVLANWKLRDPKRGIDAENVDLIFSFPGGESCRGFFVVSLLVELAASPGIVGALEVMHALDILDVAGIREGLEKVTHSLKKMKQTFKLMHTHVDPKTFHGTLRIFISGWRDNPMLPKGLLYEGVSKEPIQISGGSAAQSSAIQCFDSLLCIEHDEETRAYLTHMREHMPSTHCHLIETLSAGPSLREFVLSCSSWDLCQAYNACVSALLELRNYHFNIVTKYIIKPGKWVQQTGCPLSGVGDMLNKKGAGGSIFMSFLKGTRDSTESALIQNSSLW